MLNNIDVKASLQGLVIISDDRLPVRRIPLRGKPVKRFLLPYRGLLGLILICVAWPFSWAESGTGLEYTFFPLWLGFILAVDGLVLRRTGTSLIVRSPKIMAIMFILAVPYWWMFEAINQVIQNWVYIASNPETSLFSLIQTSLAFSVVIPAVFEVSELVGSFNFINRFARMPALVLNRQQVAIIGILGVLSLAALLTWPKYLFPITWLSLFFIFDPINYLTGRPSITANVRHGDWRLVVAFALGALICGFFWEMWNYQATISWQYYIGFFDFARIFHMLLLGSGGYLPFGLETYAMFHFVVGLLGWSRDANIPVRGDLGISAD